MKDRLLKDIVDYIETTDTVIRSLESKPSFSAEALTKAASALADAAFIKSEERDEIVEMFRTNPDKALESIVKVAATLPKEASSDYSLGAPSGVAAPSRHLKESDRVLYEKLGLI